MMSFERNINFGITRMFSVGISGIITQCFALLMLLCMSSAFAQSNTIKAIDVLPHGSGVIVNVTLEKPISKNPLGFAVTNPARIAVDFSDTKNLTGQQKKEINLGDVMNMDVVEAGGRSRLIFNLRNPLNYATFAKGNIAQIIIDESINMEQNIQDNSPPAITSPAVVNPATGKFSNALRGLDFRRGSAGEGHIVVDLPGSHIGADIRQKSGILEVDFLNAQLSDAMRQKLDVKDFGTPVEMITTRKHGKNVRMQIHSNGNWEYNAYQNDSQFVVDIKPIIEDPNKLKQGSQPYKGERLSLNFQNVEVRAVLQVIADFTGLNIIASDSVGGNVTLRLKDVPWDQALDIVMRAKGLDMRRNGSVLWIAPKDELLAKERFELEQEKAIEELSPLRTEVFQLNYKKASDFKTIFDLDDDGRKRTTTANEDTNSFLSRRGRVVLDQRTNQIIMTDIPSYIEIVRLLIERIDVQQKQVMIEARIVEAEDTFSRGIGVKWGFMAPGGRQGNLFHNVSIGTDYQNYTSSTSNVNLPAATTVSGVSAEAAKIALGVVSNNGTKLLDLELTALESDNRGRIISSPRVVTADQVKAIIEQGTEIPYLEASSSGSTSVSYKDAVLKLEVTPQITPDGNIILTVDVSKDSPGDNVGFGLAIDTKHVQTEVVVENGGTVGLGGIFQQEERDVVNKVPLLGDLPMVGWLFKNKYRLNDKTELLIFLTPRILMSNTQVAVK